MSIFPNDTGHARVRIESAIIAGFLLRFLAQYTWLVLMQQLFALCSRRLEYILPSSLAAET